MRTIGAGDHNENRLYYIIIYTLYYAIFPFIFPIHHAVVVDY